MTAAHQPKPPREIWVSLEDVGLGDDYPRFASWFEDAADMFAATKRSLYTRRYVLAPAAKPRRKRKAGKR